MQIRNQLFIGGQWINSSSGDTAKVINPATNEVITRTQMASPGDLQNAIKAAESAFERVWGRMNPFERSKYLHRVGDAIERNQKFIAEVETDDVGKPIIESLNVDVASAAATFHYFADICLEVMGEVKPSPFNEVLDYTVREPIGVVGAIIPWNFPFLIASRKIASALAAGNTMVIKPATWAPLSTLLFGELFTEAEVPPGVLNVVTGTGAATGQAFTESSAIEEITFTGSTDIGRRLYGSCTSRLKGCTLELGGKSPAVVLADCNLEETIDGVLFGVYLNQGECCCAATRLIVEAGIYDAFVERFVAASKAIKVGMPREETTRMGPLIHPDHLKTVMNYVESGKAEGAKLLCGGKVLTEGEFAKGNFMEPTVFSEVTPAMKIWREEIFGPVAVITKASGIDDLVQQANDTHYGLAASVWTTNLRAAHTLASRIHAGTVWFNLHNFVFPSAPYGGYKASGLGSELGKEGVLAMTRMKNVMVNMFPNGFKWY
ncbi:MAG: aldehyde dehydrogenase family protein [Candidatus Omnitrophica bacterium]|nr:aldehyde dehydrogenase family protein [Candidatus Omnitrophota bacterium]